MCSNPGCEGQGLVMAWHWGWQAAFAFLSLPKFEAVSRGIPTAIWLLREEKKALCTSIEQESCKDPWLTQKGRANE